MLEDKHAQRILAPQCAPTVGMCWFLPFLTPVTQIRFNFSSQRRAQQPRDAGPVLVWCLHCLLLLGPRGLAEDKSQNSLSTGCVGVRDAWSLALGQHHTHTHEAQTRPGSLCYGAPCTKEHEKSSLSSTMDVALPCQSSSRCLFAVWGGGCC